MAIAVASGPLLAIPCSSRSPPLRTPRPRRVKEGELGDLILGEYLMVTFKFKKREEKSLGKIAWDCNVKSLDDFNPKLGWTRVNLKKLFHIHRVYELKRGRLQSKALRKPSLKRVLAKYSRRERNRARDFVHKLTISLFRSTEAIYTASRIEEGGDVQ
ncbi:MAG: hypothetical protein QXO55_05245 [Candidatus Korarchaeum sp.]